MQVFTTAAAVGFRNAYHRCAECAHAFFTHTPSTHVLCSCSRLPRMYPALEKWLNKMALRLGPGGVCVCGSCCFQFPPNFSSHAKGVSVFLYLFLDALLFLSMLFFFKKPCPILPLVLKMKPVSVCICL